MNCEDKGVYTSEEIIAIIKALYEKHSVEIKNFCMNYCNKDEDLAEDALQLTFLKLHETLLVPLSEREPIVNMRNWLFTVGKHCVLAQLKKHKKEFATDEIISISDTNSYAAGADEIFFESLNEGVLKAALQELKEKNATWYYIIIQIYVNGKSQTELAKEMGIGENAMYSRMRNIRAWANKYLQDYKNNML